MKFVSIIKAIYYIIIILFILSAIAIGLSSFMQNSSNTVKMYLGYTILFLIGTLALMVSIAAIITPIYAIWRLSSTGSLPRIYLIGES